MVMAENPWIGVGLFLTTAGMTLTRSTFTLVYFTAPEIRAPATVLGKPESESERVRERDILDVVYSSFNEIFIAWHNLSQSAAGENYSRIFHSPFLLSVQRGGRERARDALVVAGNLSQSDFFRVMEDLLWLLLLPLHRDASA